MDSIPDILSPPPQFGSHRLAEAIAVVISRRAAGEKFPDSQVIAAYPDLMPELADELRALREMRIAQVQANTAGPADDIIEPLTSSQLNAPIVIDDDSADSPAPHLAQLRGYKLLSEISSGGQATVYKAVQESTGRIVAVKILFGGPFLSARGRERFERESRVLATLNHPNIVRIVDRGRTLDGSYFLVMDYIQGHSLDAALRVRTWSLDEVLHLFVKIMDAVQEAHAQGIVHRDLKPSNIRIDERGEPHVLDFGMARLVPAADELESTRLMTVTGQVMGSLPWSSPEQAAGGAARVDARSDVYALGMVFYEALTGTSPYPRGETIQETLHSIKNAAPIPFVKIANPPFQGLNHSLEAIVQKALAKLPDHRYASAGAMADDLRRHLSGTPALALDYHQPQRKWSWRLIAALCLLLMMSWWLYAIARRAQPIRPGPPLAVQLPTTRNSIGIDFVLIPAGEFIMGSPLSEPGRGRDETSHRERIEKPFLLSVTEITVGQYQRVMAPRPDAPPPSANADLPISNISWDDAVEFCRRLSRADGKNYRLPTEAEWEYACRAGDTAGFAGTGIIDDMAWYGGNSFNKPHPVKSKLPNRWGLYDMHGNVAEFCADAYVGNDPSASPVSATRIRPVVRGGSFEDPADACRSAARGVAWALPASESGFRLVREP
ncbi:MAG TPA: bifunctional serine/threonine-protein kinase/formylglycine-generating enzyme family protein [Tepidisphaeraceae bacterium]|jgi:serine/threonine protein kinase